VNTSSQSKNPAEADNTFTPFTFFVNRLPGYLRGRPVQGGLFQKIFFWLTANIRHGISFIKETNERLSGTYMIIHKHDMLTIDAGYVCWQGAPGR
jgi:hypothetical protein